jgi:hypothetical protein
MADRGSIPAGSEEIPEDEAITIFPDIIVHHRNTDDNLLVIEMKKSTSNIDNNYDIKKLKEFKRQLDYKYAVSLKLKTGSDNCGLQSMEYVEI